jgi:hypothetical protein
MQPIDYMMLMHGWMYVSSIDIKPLLTKFRLSLLNIKNTQFSLSGDNGNITPISLPCNSFLADHMQQ